ncbi:hypothetical protein BH11ACT3_BH11ACT3_12650 [soil metagenome]
MTKNTLMRNLGRTVQSRLAGSRGDKGAALVIVLTFVILMLGLSLSLTSVLLGQPKAVYLAERGTRTIYAAQSGLQIALGQVRTAATGAMGDAAKLPCSTSSAELTGSIEGQSATTFYSVEITYYNVDPTSQSDTWRSANKIPCNGTGLGETPEFALLESKGSAAPIVGLADTDGVRTVQAIYSFDVSNVNIPGGPILSYSLTHCLVADSATVGSKIKFLTLAQCTAAGETRTSWVYATDYEIKLASTLSGTPLCITGPISGTANQDAVLQACRVDSTRWNQLWSWTGNYSWSGQKNPISSGNSGYCLAPTDSSASLNNQYLQVRNGCSGQFSPSPLVGAGAAGKATNQIVNYKEFGRCLDVTNEQITATYLIAYPCKQDPNNGGSFNWNHKFYYNEPAVGQSQVLDQTIVVKYLETTNYCLQAPAAGVSPAYPSFKLCDGSNAQKWDRYGDTGAYAGSYLFVDNQGRCLTVNPLDVFGGDIHKVIVSACVGTLYQKWNAPSEESDSSFGSFRELG